MNRDRIFWAICGAVVLGAALYYTFVVKPLRDANADAQEVKDKLAARIVLGAVPGGDNRKVNEYIKDKKADYDKTLSSLYPLAKPGVNNLGAIPSNVFKKRETEWVQTLRGTRTAMTEVLADVSLEWDDAAKIFPEKKMPGEMALWRGWIKDVEVATDRKFAENAPQDIEVTFRESKTDVIGEQLKWLDDGRVTGYVQESGNQSEIEKRKVMRRMALRRAILMAVARARTEIPAVSVRSADAGAETETVQFRAVEKLISLNFRDVPTEENLAKMLVVGNVTPPKPPRPYIEHHFELAVSCHASVVPVLLKELSSMKQVERVRPMAFWATDVRVARPEGWPDSLAGQAEVNAERLKSFGRYCEWPLTVRISGVVPEFDPRLDPEP